MIQKVKSPTVSTAVTSSNSNNSCSLSSRSTSVN